MNMPPLYSYGLSQAVGQFSIAIPLIRLLVDNLITFAPVIGVLTDQKGAVPTIIDAKNQLQNPAFGPFGAFNAIQTDFLAQLQNK